jgi:hypothetical protein
MKRWTIRILVLLLLGAIVNVAVAWGIAMNTEHGDWSFYLNGVPNDYVFAQSDFGWPLSAMTNDADPQPRMPRRDGWYVGGWLIPLRPLWPGFAINTVFYAAVLWVLFAAPFALRKWRRIRRGLCPKCGYDLRVRASDSAVCPECGTAVSLSLGRERAGVRERAQ